MSATVRKTSFFSIHDEDSFIEECQIPTQRYGRRPFGVGFLMAGYDVRSYSTLTPKHYSFIE